jgi:hypothetical protein
MSAAEIVLSCPVLCVCITHITLFGDNRYLTATEKYGSPRARYRNFGTLHSEFSEFFRCTDRVLQGQKGPYKSGRDYPGNKHHFYWPNRTSL